MSEKRFEKWNDNSCKVKDNLENTLLNWEDVVKKLNEQELTIESLKEENKQLKKSEKINTDYAEQIVEENQKLRIAKNDLRREKEQLQKENEQLHLAIEDLLTHTSCEKVKKENSDLRQNITIIKDLLSECDLFSDKATKHDIIAYKEMRQFDNKDAYCICTAIKKAIEKLKRCNDEWED